MNDDYCPLIRKNCIEHKCKFFTQVIGKNPQTGQEIGTWDCAISWLPMLLIEGSQQGRHTGAAIESFRNEMVQIQQAIGHPTLDTEQIENQESETVKQIS